jgi:hypothetical protein
MLFGEPETTHFLAAVQRLKRLIRRKERLTRQARQRLKLTLRNLRTC